MKKIIFFLFLCLGLGVRGVEAVRPVSPTVTVIPVETLIPTSVPKTNITEPKAVGELEQIVGESGGEKWIGVNSLRLFIQLAVTRGVAANTIVLLLLLPLVATLISVLHYVFGLSGYGIFMPTMMAVAFLATGVLGGIVLFAMILAISLASNFFLKRFKLHFWPARAINLILIGWGTFGLMVVSSNFWFFDLKSISIFPILFMILLTEDFVRTQLAKSKSEAKRLMVGTLVLAAVGAEMMQIRGFQVWVLLHPELSMILGLVVNFLVGSYTGIRWSEMRRFKKAIRRNSKN